MARAPEPRSDRPLVELRDVRRTFVNDDGARVEALAGVSLSIRSGEYVAIVGRSGSGKTTLMHVLGCLDRPTGGEYLIDGADVSAFDADGLAWLRREFFGFVFQNYHLMGDATACENVEAPAVYAGVSRDKRRRRAERLLKSLGLGDRIGHYPHQLSGGQQQRVAIARALMNGGRILLADEPTGALDETSARQLLIVLEGLVRQGHTVIVVTHKEDVARRADRRLRIENGVIVEDVRAEDAAPSSGRTPAAPDMSPAARSPRMSLGEWSETVASAIRSLARHKLRTFLTLLGVAIGVGAVVAMLAIGEAARNRLLAEIGARGANLLSLAVKLKEKPHARFTLEDLQAMAALPEVLAVLPNLYVRKTLRSGSGDHATRIHVTTASFAAAERWPLARGAFFTGEEDERFDTVAVLGDTVARELFPDGGDPVGEYVLIENIPFLVVGVLSRRGAGGFAGNWDDGVYVPIRTAAVRLVGSPLVLSANVRVRDAAEIEAARARIRSLLIERHREEDFVIRDAELMRKTRAEAVFRTGALLGAIGAGMLLVAGIGIMNVMLVAVAERTREIGVRIATGARRRHILVQFLAEAAAVSASGGVAGIGLALAIGTAAAWLSDGIEVAFTPGAAAVAFATAVATGLAFGLAPARRAARLDPVAALAAD